jgi:quinol monooxygenase YgiN
MCKTWLSNQLPTACLERRVYEDALAPTDLLLEEQWLDAEEMNSYLSAERFRAVVGAVKVLGKLIDVRTSEMKIVETG